MLSLLGLLLVTGCGFQLRGTDLSTLGELNVIGVYGETRKAYVRSFESQGVVVADESGEGLIVSIEDQRTQRRPVATSATIDAAQYELRIELDFSVSRGSNVIVPYTTVAAERIYSVDSLNLAGSYEEQMLLLDDIRADLTYQMLQRIESWMLESGA